MDEFFQTLSSIKSIAGDAVLIMLFALFIYMLFNDLMGGLKLIIMVLRLYHSSNKTLIIKHIQSLLKVKGEFIGKVVNYEYIKTISASKLDAIIRNYTTIETEKKEFGIASKAMTKYYTDLQKACVDNKEQLDKTYNDLSHCIVVGQSEGNVLLANRVANILGLRFIIVGALAGKDCSIFGTIHKKDKAIIVDDIVFTGGLLEKTISTLEASSIPCFRIFALLKRSNVCQEKVAQIGQKYGKEITVVAMKTILDNDMREIFE